MPCAREQRPELARLGQAMVDPAQFALVFEVASVLLLAPVPTGPQHGHASLRRVEHGSRKLRLAQAHVGRSPPS
mgnify:CR=1 FL=1